MPYDAVVIGAGVNGLAAAVHLSGQRLESRGDRARRRRRRRGQDPRDHPARLSPRPLCDEFRAVRRLAVFRRPQGPAVRAGSRFRDRRALLRQRLSGRHLARRRKKSRGERAADRRAQRRRRRALARHDGRVRPDAPHIFGLLGAPVPSWQAARTIFAAWRARGTNWVADTARLLASSPREWLDENFENDKLKAMLAVWGMHLDFSPDVAGGALFPYLEAMADQVFGMALGRARRRHHHHRHGPRDRGRRRRGAAQRAGAKRCDRRRRREGGGAGERRTPRGDARGDRQPASAHPVRRAGARRAAGGAAARQTPSRPGDDDDSLGAQPICRPGSAGADLRKFAYVHLAPSLARDGADLHRGARRPAAGRAGACRRPADRDRSFARAGRAARAVGAGAGAAVADSRRCGGHDRAAPNGIRSKDAYADRVIGIIERYAPGFSATILGRAVLSPADLERDNPNLVGGDSLGGSHHLDQNFFFRPAFGWSRYRTPVERLYMVGASTWPGAGAGAGSGFMLAKMLAGSVSLAPPRDRE